MPKFSSSITWNAIQKKCIISNWAKKISDKFEDLPLQNAPRLLNVSYKFFKFFYASQRFLTANTVFFYLFGEEVIQNFMKIHYKIY